MPQLPITNIMVAKEIAGSFNASTERKLWKAVVGGVSKAPTVRFKSVASMVCLTYYIRDNCFKVEFTRTSVAFGDFMASIYRDLGAILASLKASGYPFAAIVAETAVLRVEYDPRAKTSTVAIANHGDDWQDVEPLPFKVPERPPENDKITIDLL